MEDDKLIPLDDEISGIAKDLFFKDKDKNIYAKPTDICRFVGYSNPKVTASQVYSKHKDRLEKFEMVNETLTSQGLKETRFLSNEGIHYFIMKLKLPLAKDLQMDYARIVEYHRKKELNLQDPIQRGKIISQQLVAVFEALETQDSRVESLEEGQEELKTLVEALNNTIDGTQQHKIEKLVKDLVFIADKKYPDRGRKRLFKSFNGIVKDYWEVNKREQIPKDCFDKTMAVLYCLKERISKNDLDLPGFISAEYVKRICGHANYYPNKQTTL